MASAALVTATAMVAPHATATAPTTTAGALRPLLLASALADPPMISDAAQQALARCHWREQWMGAQYVDPLARLPAEVRARRANTDSVAGAGGRR